MSQPTISVEGLSKRYVIQHESHQDTLRDALRHGARKLWRKYRWGTGFTKEEFWALRDVSFEVKQGEVLGIIGRNGAGKSTLLKILSRITEPTKGHVTLRGRIASLLEVGTGFHPELSGRENVFLNGAILGMSRAEIRRKFDEIVAFAEVERFLDTPVKRYSSGMYVRLAFAVAAHLEPEILIVDEVLAVGDAQFQQKCIRQMRSLTQESGRTILFVSHNLKTVEQLCSRALLLDSGRLVHIDSASATLAEYLRRNSPTIAGDVAFDVNDELRVTQLLIPTAAVVAGDGPIVFNLTLNATRDCQVFDLHLYVTDTFGERRALIDLRDPEAMGGVRTLSPGTNLVLNGRIKRMALVEGDYHVGLCVRTARCFKAFDNLTGFQVKPPQGSRELTRYATEYLGSTHLDYDFEVLTS